MTKTERHRWFRSFKSSQALAQSVFGALGSFDRLDLLDGVVAECGRPAFIEDTRGASFVLEHEVRSLGEPKPTSIDVLLEAGSKRVAVECKLTERKFGVCHCRRQFSRCRGDATPRVAGTHRRWAPPSAASRAKEGSSRVLAVAPAD